MKKPRGSGVDIVVKWNEGTGPNAVPGEPDPALIRKLAAELGRMAARYAMAEARAARDAAVKGDLKAVKRPDAACSPQPTKRRGRAQKKQFCDPTD